MTAPPDTRDEIIAAALLMGAVFDKSSAGRRMHRATGAGHGTGWYERDYDAALAFLRFYGFHLDFNGHLTKA